MRAPTKTSRRDAELERASSEARFVKDEFEVAELQRACAATAVGFEAVARELPRAVEQGRGERWVEGIFELHARHLGNAIGYDTIAAGGDHANTLHWIRNDGDLSDGDLLLLDAGVEVNTLYTADVTRTLPVSGTLHPAAAARLRGRPRGAERGHRGLPRRGCPSPTCTGQPSRCSRASSRSWASCPSAPSSRCRADGGQHRRWMVHGTSHHLGLDVHDCAHARAEEYRLGTLRAGMVITVEPGVYFKSTDLLVPEEYRGIGVRIEDDILITDSDPVNLSEALPRTADDVERWLARSRG